MTEAEVIDRINSTIKKNGNRTITGDEMNFILKAIIELIVESGGSKPLDSVLADGNETLEYDIILTELDRIVVGANRAGLGKGTFNTGRGGDKGVSLQCAVELELNWQAGYLRVLTPGGDGTPLLLNSDSEIVYTELVPTTPAYGKSLVTKDYADTKQSKTIVVSSNQIAVNDENYVNVANATYTDPSPVEGKGYQVFVRNGTATINSVGYTENTTIIRLFHSGSWLSYVTSGTNTGDNFILSGAPIQSNAGVGGAVRYYGFSDNIAATTETSRRIVITKNTIFKGFYLRTSGTQPVTGSHIITVLKNGVATGITITIPAGSGTGVFSETVNTISTVAGDELSLEAINNALTTSSIIISYSLGVL